MDDHERMNYWWKRAKSAEEKLDSIKKILEDVKEERTLEQKIFEIAELTKAEITSN